ncbi:MAG: restriction endonuclease subunit S [Prevotella sp.]
MKYIEKLLKGAEVKWMPLGEVCAIKTGKGVTKNDANSNGIYPIISGGKTPMDYIDTYNRQANTVTVSRVGANAGFVSYIKEKFYLNDKCFSVIPNPSNSIVSRFLYYALKSQEHKISALQSEGGVPTINTTKLGNVTIPIPPLHVQEEIVRILDKFTALEAELEAELNCRKRQYEYYRNQLLSFDMLTRGGQKLNSVSWLTLGEVFETRNGYTPSKANAAFWENGTIPWFRMEDIRANGGVLKDSIQHVTPQAIKGKGLFMAGSIIMATTATIGEHALITVDALANQRFTNFRVRNSMVDKLLTKFVYYYFFVIDEWCKQNVNVSSFPSVEIERLKKQPFPIPPLAEQQRIVSILDKFEALTTSISEGLPKEIALRRKQYEYYRNQLLSFA